jgi:5-methylcytosine-specific restriction protein A
VSRKLLTLKPRVLTAEPRLQTVNPNSWREGKTTAERGYGARWQRARLRFLAKHPLCVMCEAENRVGAATVVDHIKPHRGDMVLFWDEANWQPLCAHHHSSDKAKAEAEG